MEVIKKNDLSDGMRVAIATPITAGWGSYTGLIQYTIKTISRVTPMKTKVVCDDGKEYATKNTVFYNPCEEMVVENRRVVAFISMVKSIRFLYEAPQKHLVGSVEQMEATSKELKSICDYVKARWKSNV
ncbi:MAG: hypothetical protein ACI3XN_04190 [Eubacteriales bacterium]